MNRRLGHALNFSLSCYKARQVILGRVRVGPAWKQHGPGIGRHLIRFRVPTSLVSNSLLDSPGVGRCHPFVFSASRHEPTMRTDCGRPGAQRPAALPVGPRPRCALHRRARPGAQRPSPQAPAQRPSPDLPTATERQRPMRAYWDCPSSTSPGPKVCAKLPRARDADC
jgi:hypothetical protein